MLGYPFFVVSDWPVSELERWATYFELQQDIRDGKKIINPETITIEESERQLIEFLGGGDIMEI